MKQCLGITNKGERCKKQLKNKLFCSRHCPAPHWNKIPDECPICHDDIKPEESLLSCGHYVHWTCLDKWERGYKCPICNTDLPERKRNNIISPIFGQVDWDDDTVDLEHSPKVRITVIIPAEDEEYFVAILNEIYCDVRVENVQGPLME